MKNGDGFLCENFRGYSKNEKCPCKVGDTVRFTPSERTKKRFKWSFLYSDPTPGVEYTVKKIINGIWILVDDDIHGFYWKDFTPVSKSNPIK